jgi:hypothetical protein
MWIEDNWQYITALRMMFPLGTVACTSYHGCMNHRNHILPSRDNPDQYVSNPQAPRVSEMLPAFLDPLRVEEQRTPTTLIRYESHLQKFITTVGDWPLTDITSEHLSLYTLTRRA